MSARGRCALALALVVASAGSAIAQPIPGADEPTPDPAPAPEPAPDPEVRRSALFAEGRAFALAGKWEEAAEKFRDVVAIRSAPRALVALAVAEQELGHLLSAKTLLVRAVKEADQGNLKDDRASAETALAALTPIIPRVRLKRKEGDKTSISTFVDGQKKPIVDGQVEMDPGEHLLSVRALGFKPQRVALELKRGQVVAVDVSLKTYDDAKTEEAVVASKVDTWFAGPLALGLTGLATVGGAVALMAVGTGHQDEALKLCGGGNKRCPEAARYPALRGQDEILAGDALVAVGASALVASTVWFIVAAVRGPATGPAPAVRVESSDGGLALRF